MRRGILVGLLCSLAIYVILGALAIGAYKNLVDEIESLPTTTTFVIEGD
jgi:hypothetical protein